MKQYAVLAIFLMLWITGCAGSTVAQDMADSDPGIWQLNPEAVEQIAFYATDSSLYNEPLLVLTEATAVSDFAFLVGGAQRQIAQPDASPAFRHLAQPVTSVYWEPNYLVRVVYSDQQEPVERELTVAYASADSVIKERYLYLPDGLQIWIYDLPQEELSHFWSQYQDSLAVWDFWPKSDQGRRIYGF